MKIYTTFFLFIYSLPLLGNNSCSSPEARQFDFWIGEWKVEWKDSTGKVFEGKNNVTSLLNDCVIEENFDGEPGIKFKGKSVSVYNSEKKIWQQTWVDDTGDYIVLEGEYKDGKMILYTERISNGKKILLRMVFYNIEKDKFDWNWEHSLDNGISWENLWAIHYTRIN